MSSISISEVSFAWASAEQQQRGLLGYVSLLLDGRLKLDGLCVRRTMSGNLALSYPCRRDRSGRDHPIVRPISDRARLDFERQVFDALGVPQ